MSNGKVTPAQAGEMFAGAARVTSTSVKPGKIGGKVPSLGLNFKPVRSIVEITAEKAAVNETMETFKVLRGDTDKPGENNLSSIPGNIRMTMSTLFGVLTVSGDEADSKGVVDTKEACLDGLKGLCDLSAITGLDLLSEQQKKVLAGVARATAYRAAIDLVCLEGQKPTHAELRSMEEMLLDIGVMRPERTVDEEVLDQAGHKTGQILKADNIGAMVPRVVKVSKRYFVVNALSDDVATHRGRHQAACLAVIEDSRNARASAVEDLKTTATISFADLLDGKEGVAVVFAPKGEPRTMKDFTNGGTREVVDPAGNLALKAKKVKDAVFIEVVAAAGSDGFMRRFERIINPQGRNPVTRGYFVEELSKLDPRSTKGDWCSVEGLINTVPAPIGFIKNPNDDQKAFLGDQKVLWGFLKRATLFAFSQKGELVALRQEGDVYVKDWLADAPGRTVMFETGPDRIVFAATRGENGTVSFEFPDRLKTVFTGVEPGVVYETMPASMEEVIVRISAVINRVVNDGVVEEAASGK